MRTIEESQWRASQRQHANDLQPILKAQRGRRARAEKHPVVDFLFTYYSIRPGHRIQWSTGYGVGLENAREEFAQRRYWVSGDAGEDSRLSLSAMGKRQRREVFWIHELLKAVRSCYKVSQAVTSRYEVSGAIISCHGVLAAVMRR